MKKNCIRVISLLICAIMLITGLPFTVAAADPITGSYANAYGGTNNKIADPSTLNDWKLFFGPDKKDTAYAGSVWTDKSVFNSVAEYLAATDEADDNISLSLNDPNNHLVALSAIASSKSVEGFSTLPSDTILILDLSSSMSTENLNAMVQAANDAILKLQELNANNRIGVVAYSMDHDGTEVILPLGRYTAGLDGNNQSAFLVSSWRANNRTQTGVKVANGVTGTIADGVNATFSTSNSSGVANGTYIQSGMSAAYEMLRDVTDKTVTEGIQAGIERTPVMVLLSDGAPTQATTSYTDIGENTHYSGSTTSNNGYAFLTQLTASYFRDKMEELYGVSPLFYTLGLGVGNNAPAKNVLDPANNTETDDYWNTFLDLANASDKTMSVTMGTGGFGFGGSSSNTTITYTAPVNAQKGWSQDYVTQYFPASDTAGLIAAFEDIVEHIIIQSLYYPTLVEDDDIHHDGFLEFDDYIGKGMDVKAVKGIQLGTTLYDGHTLAKMIYDGGMGTVDNPTDAGNNLVWSVQERLGIDDVLTARTLLQNAYNDGQLYYDPTTGEYSNYIGWFGDADGNYIAYWNGTEEALANAPADAVFAAKSYGYYDAVGEGHRKTDMMYATIQVRKTIKDDPANPDASEIGDIRVIGRLPASLIPLVEYSVTLNGLDPMNPDELTISGATAPSRLIYEVGLSDEVDLLDLANTAAENKQADGTYVFYTNQWSDIGNYSYATNKNTIAFFSPSVENERYYYNADTPIYSDTEGTPYTGDTAPANATFYHRFIIYKENGALTASYAYEPISEHVLTEHDHLYRGENGQWFVKRGTIHHYYGDYTIAKTDNATGTIGYSDHPFIHDPIVGVPGNKGEYHVDTYLGNNGKLILDAYEGIKIKKIADATITDREQLYTFVISNTVDPHFGEEVLMILEDAEGNRTEGTVQFSNGTATLQLATGQTAYIVGAAMEEQIFHVTEDVPTGIGYELYSINDDTSAVEINLYAAKDTIAGATFVNTAGNTPPKVYEPISVDISGTKTLQSDIRHLQAGAFTFELVDKTSGNVLRQVQNAAPTGNNVAPFTFQLSYETEGTFEYLIRERVPQENGTPVYEKDGTTYDATVYNVTVTVTDVNNALVANVAVENDADIDFENAYDVEKTAITLEGVKTLVGDAISNHTGEDAFEFNLYNASWDDSSQSVVKGSLLDTAKNGADGKFTFDEISYSTTGAHRYILEEVVPATPKKRMTYDKSVYYIEVDVVDDFVGGLDTAMTITKVTEDGVTSTVSSVNFVNVYAAEPITVPVAGEKSYTKELTDGLFTFELYQAMKAADGAINPVGDPVLYAQNDAQGDFAFADDGTSYLTFDRTGTYYFAVKESIPAEAVDKTFEGVTYDDTLYTLTVVINEEINNEGRTELTYKLYINGDENGSIAFDNTYAASADEGAILTGTKTLTGKDIEDDMFTFELYDATMDDRRKVTLGNKRGETANIGNGFSFTEIEYTSLADAKTHLYVIKEQIPAGAVENTLDGMTYDATAWLAEVTVEDNGKGALIVNAPVYFAIDEEGIAAGAPQPLVIANSYEASSDKDVVIGGTKKLTGKALSDDAFTFELYAATLDDQDNVILGQKIDAKTNTGDRFAFDPVKYLTVQNVGTHYYVVKEHIPAEADENNVLGNVTYDASAFLAEITVSDNGDGTLNVSDPFYYEIENNKPDHTAQNGPVFENLFTPTAITYTIGGKKILVKDDLEVSLGNLQFSFALYETDGTYAIPEGTAPLETVKNAASGLFAFTAIEAKDATVKHYVVKELASPYDNITTDTKTYKVCVTVTNTDGVLASDIDILLDDQAAEAITFTNAYKPEPEPPVNPPAEPPAEPEKPQDPQDPPAQPQEPAAPPSSNPDTGEAGDPMLWLMMLLTSGAGLIALGGLKKKKESR